MRSGGGDGVGEAISEDTADADTETMGVGEAVSEDIADADTETTGVGKAVSEDTADADTETTGSSESRKACSLGVNARHPPCVNNGSGSIAASGSPGLGASGSGGVAQWIWGDMKYSMGYGTARQI